MLMVQLEGLLEEMLMLCQRGEEYHQFLLARVGDAFSPKPVPAFQENSFRRGAFNTAIRELTSYYINLVSRTQPTIHCVKRLRQGFEWFCIGDDIV